MKARRKLIVWAALTYAALLVLCAAVVGLLAAGLQPAQRELFLQILAEKAPLLAFLALLLAFASGAAVKWFFDQYVTAAHALAEQTGVVLGANSALEVGAGGGHEIAELAAAINRLAGAYRELQRDVEARAREAGARLEAERNRLAALMAELSEGVLLCNAEGRILLYNERARSLFAPAEAGASPLVGLGRSVFALIDRDQVAHALEKLARRLQPGQAPPATRFVIATASARLLRVTAAPFLDAAGAIAGIVLAFEDVTAQLDQETTRRGLLQSLAAGLRAPAANIRAAAENLASYPDMDAARREQFVGIVAAEAQELSRHLGAALRVYADALKAGIAVESMRSADLVAVLRQRVHAMLGLEAAPGDVDDSLWLNVDSFAFVQAIAFLAARLRDLHGVRRLRFSVNASGGNAQLDMSWDNAAVPSDALSSWEDEPMQLGAEQTPLTVRDVLERHGGEVWYQAAGPGGGQPRFRFLLPAGEALAAPARPTQAPAQAESRPEYYDFDLFRDGGAPQAMQERRLSELAYTVFDTETTGLEPSAGDEIISIGAVRIVNGRLLKGEVFEQLVDPRRSLSRESAAIHGIDAAALRGQPAIEQVLPSFHRFCEDSVLVAHNAAFDMRFLQLKEASSGVRFTQPVLDTLLLSAAVHPAHADHRLESIAERLGVSVIGRHTALGDALLTGEIFLKLLPLLAGRGIGTLGEALSASRDTYYARLQY